MRTIGSYLLCILFLMSTIGMNVQTHFCCGEVVEVDVNGLALSLDDEMGCSAGGCGCGGCESTTLQTKCETDGQYLQGQMVKTQPRICVVAPIDIQYIFILYTAEEGGHVEPWFYQSPYHPDISIPQGGLRAPPSQA